MEIFAILAYWLIFDLKITTKPPRSFTSFSPRERRGSGFTSNEVAICNGRKF